MRRRFMASLLTIAIALFALLAWFMPRAREAPPRVTVPYVDSSPNDGRPDRDPPPDPAGIVV